jgi:hypothetical protein
MLGNLWQNSVLHCSSSECGIIIDRDNNGASNIFMLLTKIVQKERRPEPFCRLSFEQKKHPVKTGINTVRKATVRGERVLCSVC